MLLFVLFTRINIPGVALGQVILLMNPFPEERNCSIELLPKLGYYRGSWRPKPNLSLLKEMLSPDSYKGCSRYSERIAVQLALGS